jgi:glycosyltransferase involved in cell wall biosynthesis
VVVQRDLIDDARDALSKKASDAVDTVSDLASGAADAASCVVDRVMAELRSAIDAGIGQITEGWKLVRSGVNGIVDTRIGTLVDAMSELIADPAEARRLGEAGRQMAEERFGIERFVGDWMSALREVAG